MWEALVLRKMGVAMRSCLLVWCHCRFLRGGRAMSQGMWAPRAQDGPETDAQNSWIQEHHNHRVLTRQGVGKTVASV